jgi:hypothetical protein
MLEHKKKIIALIVVRLGIYATAFLTEFGTQSANLVIETIKTTLGEKSGH